MKTITNKIIIVVMSFLMFTPSTNAQTVEVNDKFWVMSSNSLTEEGEDGFTNNSQVNSVLASYNVSRYEKALPFAKTPALQKVYEVECDCNIDSLMSNLQSRFSNLYSGFKRLDYENIALYEPADWMWYSPDDWLWHLKKIQADLAWDITLGDTNVKIAILDTDFDIDHPELAGEIHPLFDPYDSIAYGCDPFNSHGTYVAGFASGETTEIGNTPNGSYAAIGFNTKMIAYKAWSGNYIQRALHASTVMGANILTSSAGGWSSCPDPTGIHALIVKEILDNGTTIIMPAGNGSGTHNFCSSLDSVNHSAFFPLSPYYDDRIILVSSTGIDDRHQFIKSDSTNGTHSHYPDVDLCAPGYEVMGAKPTDCGSVSWPYYGSWSGTSFATPIVAGVASLMYSVNPCMSPSLCQDILKNTTDPILDAANFPNGVGTGRVNAYKAVLEAQKAQSSTLDLYIKDRPEDFGNQQYPYYWQEDRDQSVDIWIRNQQDGFNNQTHQEPEYNSSSPVYVYVRVRNKSCVDASGGEDLSLYWSKASSWSSWPQNWDGSQPTIGDQIGSINLGNLGAGKDTIIEFEWNILNPYIHQNWTSCLLARIENSPVDNITIHPNRIDDDVFYNNNIALKNVTVIDIAPGIAAPGIIEDIYYPHGKYMFVGNAQSQENIINLKFSVPKDSLQKSIIKEAEVKIIFDDLGWDLLESHLTNRDDIRVLREKEVLLLSDTVKISNIEFPANTRIPIYVGFSFLVDEVTDQPNFTYNVRQYLADGDSILGGVHFNINRYKRNPFDADAGANKEIKEGESVAINASLINESATYNWYDQTGELIYEGSAFSISPDITSKYKLEVITDADGFKDYDEMEVTVNPFWIENISPNPASNIVKVEYVADKASSAYIMLVNQTATVSNNYIIDTNLLETNIDLSSYQTGVYTVVLVCDGVAKDAKNLVVQ